MSTHNIFVIAASACALAMPAVASANTYWHPANNQRGFTEHPDHWQGAKTRAEVLRELEVARRDGSLRATQRNRVVSFPAPAAARVELGQDKRATRLGFEQRRQLDLNSGG